MEDSGILLESSEPTSESNRAPDGNASGRIDLRYTKADGTIQKWSLIKFALRTSYDERKRIWSSVGHGDSRTHRYAMNITYDVSDRLLTVSLQNRVFTIPGTHMQATNFNDRSTLNISILRDAEGTADAFGDQYLMKGGSHLNISV